jgi:hypothetical protein
MEDCTWYANDLAIYKGTGGTTGTGAPGPTADLVFKNNVFIDNSSPT